MSFNQTEKTGMGCNAIIGLYSLITWIVNLVKFVKLDFVEPFKDELVHGLGVLLPPVAWVTAWL